MGNLAEKHLEDSQSEFSRKTEDWAAEQNVLALLHASEPAKIWRAEVKPPCTLRVNTTRTTWWLSWNLPLSGWAAEAKGSG